MQITVHLIFAYCFTALPQSAPVLISDSPPSSKLDLKMDSKGIPITPFNDPSNACIKNDGDNLDLDGYPGTPFIIEPFKEKYKAPNDAKPSGKACRADGHCMLTYGLSMKNTEFRPFDSTIKACKSLPPTQFLSFESQIQGPTIRAPFAHESLIRFNNQINVSGENSRFGGFSPCDTNGRSGRPTSIHLHGSASLASYDGWAEDETCFNESKDYVYPNNKANTGWYHDHALHITADNAYYGLSGAYIVSQKVKDGGCGEPYNLEDIPEQVMMLSDKVLDSKCQLYADPKGAHSFGLFGDINMVNGVPFPVMNLKPQWQRFRFINSAVSRPWLIQFKDENLKNVGPELCRVIASDGGFRASPASFPSSGVLITTAERYEIVCDFSQMKSKSIYIWNDQDAKRMWGVPYFCHSHLIAKVEFNTEPDSKPAVFQPNLLPKTGLDTVLSKEDIQKAMDMAAKGESHRDFLFGPKGGKWTINGETWDSKKFAAEDIGQNTWELWKFSAHGGFHPVHIHLVDFFILKRGNGVQSYELLSPKDVFQLVGKEDVYTIARFGAHKGDYMFHCHNMIHEDNDMIRAFKVVDHEKGKNSNTSLPFVLNPLHNLVYGNFKYEDPLLGETNPKASSNMTPLTQSLAQNMVNNNLYRIFYPMESDIAMMKGAIDPWQSKWCPLQN